MHKSLQKLASKKSRTDLSKVGFAIYTRPHHGSNKRLCGVLQLRPGNLCDVDHGAVLAISAQAQPFHVVLHGLPHQDRARAANLPDHLTHFLERVAVVDLFRRHACYLLYALCRAIVSIWKRLQVSDVPYSRNFPKKGWSVPLLSNLSAGRTVPTPTFRFHTGIDVLIDMFLVAI